MTGRTIHTRVLDPLHQDCWKIYIRDKLTLKYFLCVRAKVTRECQILRTNINSCESKLQNRVSTYWMLIQSNAISACKESGTTDYMSNALES